VERNVEFLLVVIFQIGFGGSPDDVTLDKICYSPFTAENAKPASPDQCLVLSIWGYYQDDVATFNETSEDPNGLTLNYLDHFKSCSQ